MTGGQKTVGILYQEAVDLIKVKYWQLVGSGAALTIAVFVFSLIIIAFSFIMNIVMNAALLPISAVMSLIPVGLLPISGNDFVSGAEAAGYLTAALLTTLIVCVILLLVMLIFFLLYLVVYMAMAIMEQTIAVGVMEAMLKIIKGERPMFSGAWVSFKCQWKRYLGVSAWTMLWTMLWSLLFIIPGCYMAYSYILAPYLVIQYPEMTVRQALRKSIEITNGYKGRLFLISLIMMGFLMAAGLVACCIFPALYAAMLFWIYPLYFAMMAIAYLDIKQAAIEKGLLPSLAANDTGEQQK